MTLQDREGRSLAEVLGQFQDTGLYVLLGRGRGVLRGGRCGDRLDGSRPSAIFYESFLLEK